MKISILKVQASDLERAINAMLKPVADPKDPGYHAYQDIYTVSNMRAREYISMLYTCTEVLLNYKEKSRFTCIDHNVWKLIRSNYG